MRPARSMITFAQFPFVIKTESLSETATVRLKSSILQRERKSLTSKVITVELAVLIGQMDY